MARLQWLDDETHIRELVLEELGTRTKNLFMEVAKLDSGCMLLRFLNENAKTLMTIDDIAYHLLEPHHAVARTLETMKAMGLVRQVEAAGLALYGITDDPDKRHMVRGLCQWQDRWHIRIAGIKRVIYGGGDFLEAK